MHSSTTTGPILSARIKAAVLLTAVIVLAVTAHRIIPENWPPLGLDILHSLHGAGFAVIALIILLYLNRKRRTTGNYALAAAIAMAIGVISEVAQIPGPRDAQIRDLLVDATGIVGALGLVATFDKQIHAIGSAWLRLVIPLIAIAAIAAACLPTLWYGYALARQTAAFPTLLDFEARWEIATLSHRSEANIDIIGIPPRWPGTGDSLALAYDVGGRGRFFSLEPLPNWLGYSGLTFVAAAAATPFPMTFCIRDVRPSKDAERNRFCKRFLLTAEPTLFTIEFGEIDEQMTKRPFDFSRISLVTFSAAQAGDEGPLLIDNVRLRR